MLLQYIENQTDELCNIAVSQNILALCYIKNKQSKSISNMKYNNKL